jgi:hypothetical protein
VALTPSLRSGFRAFSRGPRSFDSPMLAAVAAPRFGLRVLYYLILTLPKKCGVSPFEASASALRATAGQARTDVSSRPQTCQAPARHTADCAAIGVSRSRRSAIFAGTPLFRLSNARRIRGSAFRSQSFVLFDFNSTQKMRRFAI